MHYYKCNKNATIRNQSFNNKIIFNNERIYYYSLTCPATLNPPFCRIVFKGWMWCYWLWNVEKLRNDWHWDWSQRQSEYSIPSLQSSNLFGINLLNSKDIESIRVLQNLKVLECPWIWKQKFKALNVLEFVKKYLKVHKFFLL